MDNLQDTPRHFWSVCRGTLPNALPVLAGITACLILIGLRGDLIPVLERVADDFLGQLPFGFVVSVYTRPRFPT